MTQRNSAVVIGVGPERGLGATLANHFAAQGLHVYIAGRSKEKLQQVVNRIVTNGGQATAVVADATKEFDINHLFDVIHFDDAILQLAVYNVDSNIPAPILETKAETFTILWQQNCLGAFLFAKEAIECMQPNNKGTLIFTGATASLRAKPPFTAFASAKAALRSLAQGLAREFSPQGIHVVHAVIDGVINGDRAAQQFPEYYQSKGEEGMLDLEAIAETYWFMHCQHPSTWTHELDLRPFKEPF
ncbi:MAG: SDR family NAD(P)-dependent oxidoreductase [Methylococcaceae bacterium]|nr:SDR family NAD(P)-dependent oxidoreductase [Methylococcaceae bacterium]